MAAAAAAGVRTQRAMDLRGQTAASVQEQMPANRRAWQMAQTAQMQLASASQVLVAERPGHRHGRLGEHRCCPPLVVVLLAAAAVGRHGACPSFASRSRPPPIPHRQRPLQGAVAPQCRAAGAQLQTKTHHKQ